MDIQIKSSRSVLATDSAVKKLVELKAEESNEESFLRMGVKPGGCSGLSYEMFFDTERQQNDVFESYEGVDIGCLLYTSPSPRDISRSRMPSSA